MKRRSSFTGLLTDHSTSGITGRLVFGCCSAVVKPIRMSADPKLVASSGQSSNPPARTTELRRSSPRSESMEGHAEWICAAVGGSRRAEQ